MDWYCTDPIHDIFIQYCKVGEAVLVSGPTHVSEGNQARKSWSVQSSSV